MVAEPRPDGYLKATIGSTTSAGAPDNQLRAIRIVGLSNASVEIEGEEIRAPGATVGVGEGTEELHFWVHQTTAGQAYGASIVVVDDCGAWPSFVGAGPT